MNTWQGGSDVFSYNYNAKTGVLELIWDDGLYEEFSIWIDGNTMYATDGEIVEIYYRK